MERKIYDKLCDQNDLLRQQNRNLEDQLHYAEQQTDLLKQQNQLLHSQLSEQTAILTSIVGSLKNIPEMLTTMLAVNLAKN